VTITAVSTFSKSHIYIFIYFILDVVYKNSDILSRKEGKEKTMRLEILDTAGAFNVCNTYNMYVHVCT